MKKITLIFSLMLAMFTTSMAQETVDFSAGTFSGEYNNDKGCHSQWTSENGITIVAKDATYNEVAAMKYHNNKFQLDITDEVAQPATYGIKYTITVPEGYTLTEMKVKNSSRSNEMYIDYTNIDNDYTTLELKGKTNEETIVFAKDKYSFSLRGQVGRSINITSLTITKETGIEEVVAETEKVIYDLTGRHIDEITTAGVYIINSKKVLVK